MDVISTSSLPTVVLRERKIPLEVLQFIPLGMVKKYQISAFESDPTTLKLAIVFPEQLKQGFVTALQDVGKKVGKKIELHKTDAASMQAVIKLYEEQTKTTPKSVVQNPLDQNKHSALFAAAAAAHDDPASPTAQLKPLPPHVPVPHTPTPPSPTTVAPSTSHRTAKPPLFEVGKTVAFNYLRRIPLDYSKAHRLVCVDFLKPNIYWFVSDGTREDDLKKAIPLIEKENKILVERITIQKKEFDDLLDYYKQLIDEANRAKINEVEGKEEAQILSAQKEEEVKKTVQKELPASKPVAKPAPSTAEVTVPDDNASIVTSINEKEGIAGFFQRVNLTLAGSPKEEEKEPETIPAKEGLGVPIVAAPETGVSSRSVALPTPITKPGPNELTPPPAPAPAVPAAPAQVGEPAPTPTAAPQTTKTDDETGDIGKLLEKQVESLDELKEIIKKGFIPRIVAAVVSYAIHEKASDVHVESFLDEVRIRYRIDGQLIDIVKLPADVHAAMVSRIKILSRLRLDETRVPQDGRFDVNFENAQVDLRVSLMPTVHGEKVVLRILDKSRGIASLEKLGIEGLAYDNLTKSIQKPFGICLATGPTGSGKSTSLYAILNRIATPNVNVVTLEDPVEYEMKGINQAQIRPKIGFTFAEGLRSILRQDPNIIMVGEIRDGETANMATQAALTGHLVLSTLHTNDAAGAIPRMTNMGIEPFLIASSLNVAMGQRLVRKICPDCKKEVSLPPGFKAQIETDLHTIEALNPSDAARIKWPLHFYQGMGCATCGGKGYLGRVGIYEVLVMSEAVEDLTLKQASNEHIQMQAQKEGMLTMYQDGLIKVINGITTLDEVLRETSSR